MAQKYQKVDEEKGPLTKAIDSLEVEYTLSLPGVIYDPEEASTPEYLKDASVCNGLVHRRIVHGLLRFLMPLVATCFNAYSYAVCCPAYKAYLFATTWILAVHLLIGAYPLLCCGKPAFDLVDIFVDCIRESSALTLRGIRVCYDQTIGKCFGAGIQTAVPPPTATDKQTTVVADLCAPVVLCCGPCGKCIARLWEFAFSLPLWSVVLMGVAVLIVDGAYLFSAQLIDPAACGGACLTYRMIVVFCVVCNASLTGARLAHGSDGSYKGLANFYTSL